MRLRATHRVQFPQGPDERRTRVIRSAARVLFTVAIAVTVAGGLMAQPTFGRNSRSAVAVDAERLQ
jgi:hypothetical protein